MAAPADLRARMVERQLRWRGIGDERVLAAMAAVPRELFLPAELRDRAYADSALPIGAGQTISQPWIVAAICQALRLRGDEDVLEVGTGSGYSAAVLARLAATVVSVERDAALAAGARAALSAAAGRGSADPADPAAAAGPASAAAAAARTAKVEVVVGDGSRGLPARAPFAAIAVHAAAPAPPPPLLAQLAEGGRMVVPLAAGEAEMLTVLRRRGDRFESESLGPCRFVPLLGDAGY